MNQQTTPSNSLSGLNGGLRILVCLVLVAALLKLCSGPEIPSRAAFLSKCMADAIAHRADLSETQVEVRCADAWTISQH